MSNSSKNYVYAKLSKRDFGLFRVEGGGLGNILFTYARSVVFAQKHHYDIIWPTWPCLMIYTILKREKDKRFYLDLFRNNSGYVDGFKKLWYLLTKKKIAENQIDQNEAEIEDDKIVVFEGMEGCFEPIMHDYDVVYENLCKNLQKKNKKALTFDGANAICVHVRMGDFHRVSIEELNAGKHNSAIPIEWYVNIVKQLRRIAGRCVKVYVFSDGTDEELKQLIILENVERKTFGTAIADILALSQARLFIASGSSFSMWARYLGRMTTIMYPKQEKQRILQDTEFGKEISVYDKIPSEHELLIRSILNSNNIKAHK